jgi:Plavaka transposase
MQSKLPEGATLCGVILSSDKTHITNMCGGKAAHPLLISLANIRMAVRNKASSHAFLLVALMPIVEFLHPDKRMCSVLDARLFHQCLDIVLEPVKIAARIGRMMSDPVGNLRHCFTPLAAYILDTPEACMVACVRGKTSPVTMASYKEFGDATRQDPRTRATTLAQLARIPCNPIDVERYFAQCKQFRLSGVSAPFWRDWPLSDPANFLTPEMLHHWFGEFWDHDVQWCKNALGSKELDFRFSVLTPIVGLRHFKDGITTLKQVTGRTKRDIQRYIVPVIAGAAPTNVVIAIRALMDFRYLAQARVITSLTRDKIANALAMFHEHKHAIIEEGLRRGPTTGVALEHWQIPKLELMQSVAPSINEVGAPVQWSADTTEHAHIEVVKEPAASANNQQFDAQICRYLDRMEKCQAFETAVRLTSARDSISNGNELEDLPDSEIDAAAGADDDPSAEGQDFNENSQALLNDVWGPNRPVPNLFAIAEKLLTAVPGSIPSPIRTFTTGSTALRVNYDPSIKRITIDKAAEMFDIPDLRPAIADYLAREGSFAQKFHSFGGQRRAREEVHLPISDIQVWYKVRIQQKLHHDRNSVASVFTINAHPPNRAWKYGRRDAAILNIDERHEWPSSGLTGM